MTGNYTYDITAWEFWVSARVSSPDGVRQLNVLLLHLLQVLVSLLSVLRSVPHLILQRRPGPFQLLLQSGHLRKTSQCQCKIQQIKHSDPRYFTALCCSLPAACDHSRRHVCRRSSHPFITANRTSCSSHYCPWTNSCSFPPWREHPEAKLDQK